MTDVGLIGAGAIGRNLALNLADAGVTVRVWDQDPAALAALAGEAASAVRVCADLRALVGELTRPRRVLVVVPAGPPVDAVLDALAPLLDAGDAVADGGNSRFQDTERRAAASASRSLGYLGVGISGGTAGARRGACFMSGGEAAVFERFRPVFEAAAADAGGWPAVVHAGPGGAGHLVKTIHNGIEYGLMQQQAEVYHLLSRAGHGASRIGDRFEDWSAGPLGSFLIALTARVLRAEDDGAPRVEAIARAAGSKGTGRWAVEVAHDLGVPVPAISAAVEARLLSALPQRAPTPPPPGAAPPPGPDVLETALLAAHRLTFLQGCAVIQAWARERGSALDLARVLRTWQGGSIVRSRLIDRLADAPTLLDPATRAEVYAARPALLEVLAWARAHAVPVPGFASCVDSLDGFAAPDLPQNLTQAQRDAFGAHGFRPVDDPSGPLRRAKW